MCSFDGIRVGGKIYKNRDTRFNPDTATADMTQDVGLDARGKLKTNPSGSGGSFAAFDDGEGNITIISTINAVDDGEGNITWG